MIFQEIVAALLLFGLGLCGWFIFSRVNLPAAHVLGPMILIGTLRALQVGLPPSPDFIFPAVQIIIGIFVGSMLNKAALKELRQMTVSALIIILWTLSVIFVIGFFLARFSVMDLYTAMLSASMGGLPEVMVIALASNASVAVIMVMQLIRMFGTVTIFPIILEKVEKRAHGKSNYTAADHYQDSEKAAEQDKSSQTEQTPVKALPVQAKISQMLSRESLHGYLRLLRESWKRILRTLVVAASGGLLLQSLGVPAGMMVGSTIFIATASILGIPTSKLPQRLLYFLLVFIGIYIADNITVETISTMANAAFLIPILLATAVMFASSFGVAWLIYRITGWDFPTSFLAAAPAGFTVMTILAIKHGRDPLKVSMLHLCRLLSIKLFLPFVFMWLL